ERTLDPLSSTQIWIAADAAVAEINDQVLARVIGNLQERTSEFTDELNTASDQLERIRSALDRDDAQTIQSVASTVANRFEDLADFLSRGGFIVGRLGLGEDAERYEESLRTGAELLRDLSATDLPTRLDEAAATLAELQEAAGELRDLNPQIAVTPFTSEVQSATPVRVTLTRYYAPGIVALMLQHIAITFAALSLVRERERGTTELLRAGPASLTERLTGKWVAFTLLGAALAAALTAAVMTAFGVPAPANWPLFVLLVLLVLTASVGYGYLVAAAASSDRQAVQFSMLLFLTTIFFAGLFMPLDRIDLPIEAISWLLPATYGTAGMQQLMLLQQDPQPLLLGGIAVMAVALFAAGRLALGILDRRR
ncbi:MAG: ABC transporter permease, partial [Nitriliruptorales bacterium]|nr:ABC transporter permease [Nitriliruptorales bacterium]